MAHTCNIAPQETLFWGLWFVSWLCRTTHVPLYIYWELERQEKLDFITWDTIKYK